MDRVNRQFKADRPNQLWVCPGQVFSDIPIGDLESSVGRHMQLLILAR